MKCPDCGGLLRGADILHIAENNENFRRRICTKCGKVVYTVEFEVEPDERFRKEWSTYASSRNKRYRRSKTKKEEPRND